MKATCLKFCLGEGFLDVVEQERRICSRPNQVTSLGIGEGL